MTFSFRELFRFVFLWLSDIRWTVRRLLIIVAFFLLIPALEVVIWLSFLIDDVLFRPYRRQPVEAPVFIVGNPRSGTTFLHRLLSRDGERFSTMQMWEILFAPAILQRRIVRALAFVGRPIAWLIARMERRWHELNVMHEVSLSEPEEDDYLLLHIFSALTVGLSSGLLRLARPYTYFDSALDPAERRRIMGFYRRCVQRHLYDRRTRDRSTGDRSTGRTYLAKNPALTPKLATVFEHFPDARVIVLVRNPLEMIPSYLSMMEFSWRAMGAPSRDGALADYLLEMAAHWYRHPLEQLADKPESQCAFVRYDELRRDPESTVREIYRRFGYTVDPAYAEVLRRAAERARSYRSRHAYDLEQLGLSRQRIVAELADVFERFGFDPGEPGAADSG